MFAYMAKVRELFNPIESGFHLLAFFALNTAMMYYMTSNLIFGIIMGVIGAVYFFHVFSYQTRVLNTYQSDLNNLMKYLTNVAFFLQTGENVYYALTTANTSLSGNIQKDVQKTITIMEKEAVLETEHFKKYDFPSIDQFHQNLHVKYNEGGDPRELFGTIQKNTLHELKKRDELYKKRKSFALSVYIMLAMVAVTGIILRLMITNLWFVFLSYSLISMAVIILTYAAVLLNLYLLQKRVNDITVHI